MSGSALLVVDLLEDFFRDQPLQGRRSELIAATNSLLGIARARQIPVVWIRQEFAPDLSDAYLEMRRRGIGVTIAGTAGAQVLAEREQRPEDAVVVKKRYSASFGTGLDSNLERWNVRRLILASINTHACIWL